MTCSQILFNWLKSLIYKILMIKEKLLSFLTVSLRLMWNLNMSSCISVVELFSLKLKHPQRYHHWDKITCHPPLFLFPRVFQMKQLTAHFFQSKGFREQINPADVCHGTTTILEATMFHLQNISVSYRSLSGTLLCSKCTSYLSQRFYKCSVTPLLDLFILDT